MIRYDDDDRRQMKLRSNTHSCELINASNERDDLTSETGTLEVTVLATLTSTLEVTTPVFCFIIAPLSIVYVINFVIYNPGLYLHIVNVKEFVLSNAYYAYF